MTRLLILLTFFAILLLAPGRAAASEAEASAAVDRFLKAPLDTDSTIIRTIMDFAEESPTHAITLEEKYLPWLNEENPPSATALLQLAFIAGNLQAQFQKHTGDSQPYAGVLAIIAVYKKIQAERPTFRVAGVEHFIELQKKGTLQAYIEAP